jgi:hypothetical protein
MSISDTDSGSYIVAGTPFRNRLCFADTCICFLYALDKNLGSCFAEIFPLCYAQFGGVQ